MSEVQHYPIPTPDDYTSAFQMSNVAFERCGGIRSHLMEVEYAASHGHRQHDFEHVSSFGLLALSLEPKNSYGIAEDRRLRITHAFKRGMLAGLYANSFVYDGEIPSAYIAQSMNTGIQHEEIDEETPFADEPPMLEWARQGIGIMGQDAEAIAGQWAGKFYDDERTKQLFRLGAGVVIATGFALRINERIAQIDQITGDSSWIEELEKLNRSNTGE